MTHLCFPFCFCVESNDPSATAFVILRRRYALARLVAQNEERKQRRRPAALIIISTTLTLLSLQNRCYWGFRRRWHIVSAERRGRRIWWWCLEICIRRPFSHSSSLPYNVVKQRIKCICIGALCISFARSETCSRKHKRCRIKKSKRSNFLPAWYLANLYLEIDTKTEEVRCYPPGPPFFCPFPHLSYIPGTRES